MLLWAMLHCQIPSLAAVRRDSPTMIAMRKNDITKLLPSMLVAVVMDCLSPEALKRPTAAQLERRLRQRKLVRQHRAFLAGDDIPPPPPPQETRAARRASLQMQTVGVL